MASAKDILVKVINSHSARGLIAKFHYSGKSTQNSQLHFGVFLNGKLEGCLQFGPPIDRRKMLPLVTGSKWGEMIELNRMAFGPKLPKYSESRAIAICFKLIKKHYPQIKWVVSFADGCQCGDGTIYRASGFYLTAINKNKTMLLMPDGTIKADKTLNDHPVKKSGWWKRNGATPINGFQLRYIYFIDKSYKEKLTVPILPFSEIDKRGAGMYKGTASTVQSRRVTKANSGDQLESGGAIPTNTLQSSEAIK
tara:strand:+ start:343 stop:1098 length:756 start_codon:yes stop_codon:yes gene_type:complete